MNATLLYSLQTILSAGVFILIYRLFVRNSNAYNWNRFYLLSTMIVSLFLPYFNISSWFTVEKPILIYAPAVMDLGQAITSTPTYQPIQNSISLSEMIMIGYWIIAGLLIIRFGWGLMKIIQLVRSNDYKKSGNLRLYPIQRKTTFSFFNYIFIQPEHWEKPSLDFIIRHEQAHVKQMHSLDNLLTELILIFGWFNPFFYIYRHDLHLLHECQADRVVINSGCDKTTYHQLLLNEVSGNLTYIIVNQFSYSLIKRRFKMISKNQQSRLAGFRILLAIPTAFALLMLFSFTSLGKTTSTIKNTILNPTVQVIQSTLDKLQNHYQNLTVNNIKTDKPDQATSKTSQQESDPLKIDRYVFVKTAEGIDKCFPGGNEAWTNFWKSNYKYPQEEIIGGPQGIIYVSFLISETGEIESPSLYKGIDAACDKEALRVISMMPKKEPILKDGKPQRVQLTLPIFLNTLIPHPVDQSTNSEEKPLDYAEQQPEFKGGFAAMLKYVGDNMHYPEAAVKAGIQGTIFVKFVVEKTGKLTNIQVERGIGTGCDEEAIRIIKSMPDWNPGLSKGKPVAVIGKVPLKFQLKATYSTTDNKQN